MTPDHVVARADRPVRLAPAPPRRPDAATARPRRRPRCSTCSVPRGTAPPPGSWSPCSAQKKKAVGVAKYGTTRLTTRLQDMMQRGVLGVAGAPATLDRDQLFMLQGVANVETGGMDNAVYTRDNMYVSLGFKQVTLGWGSLYEIIEAAPGAFAKHGIVLGGGTYTLKAGVKPAIEGAPDPVALKTPPWTDRFFAAGAEDEVVSAIVAYTLKELGRMERRFAKDSPGRSTPWMKDPTARAWLLETMNNRPAYAYTAAKGTLRADQRAGADPRRLPRRPRVGDPRRLRGAGRAGQGRAHHRQDPAGGALRRTGRGAGPVGVRRLGRAVAGRPHRRPPRRPVRRGPSWSATRPPSCHPRKAATTGSGVVAAIGAAGLVPAALRMLVAAGHGDAERADQPRVLGRPPGAVRHEAPAVAARLRAAVGGVDPAARRHRARRALRVRLGRSRRHRRRRPPRNPRREPSPRTWSPPRARRRGSPGRRRPGAATSTSRRAPATTSDVADTGEKAGQVRVWLYGSSGANVCNMTSLTMGLVSMAGEDEVRARMIGLLRTAGMHAGAQVQIGKTFVDLAAALDDPRMSARIRTLDLVTAVAIGRHGSYKSVTDAGTIARVARDAGIATKAKEATGQIRFTNPAVRAKAAQMLADGTRVILGTVNHYVYLTEVRGDGVVVHDPAGARVTPGLKGYLFVHAGNGAAMAAEFLKMDAGRQAAAMRRVTTNPAAAAVINELPAVAALPKAQRAAAAAQVAAAHPGHVETGASNFYATSEFAANDLRLRVTLSRS